MISSLVFRPSGLLSLALLGLCATALPAAELDCESGDNTEGGCCCFLEAHTYRFEPVAVSRLEVTFDTGRGLDCRSQVTIQLLGAQGWQTVRTVDASSSAGRSQMNRMSGTLDVNGTLSGVRFDDGGRCYIDYSRVAYEEAGGLAVALPPPVEQGGLATGTYRVDAYSDRAYRSTWTLERDGDVIRGTSEWDCCPGPRSDRLQGEARGDQVRIARDCSGQGASGRCLQIYEGTISGNRVGGTWSHNGRFAGRWWLDLNDLGEAAEPAGPRIVTTPAPPYPRPPVTLDFAFEGEPVAGGEWWMDGRRMTNADVFFWTFGDKGAHQVEMRDDGGNVVASYEVRLERGAAPTPPPPAPPRGLEIVADPAPPYRVSTAVTFHQAPRPVPGARWYVDGRRVADSESLTWRFDEERRYEVALKASGGAMLAMHEVLVQGQAGDHTLWGRRRLSQGAAGGIRNDFRELILERSATVARVEGSAGRFCIWAVDASGGFDQQVVCGQQDEPIVGAILLPGRYVVVPVLAEGQRSSEVTIYLRDRRIRAGG